MSEKELEKSLGHNDARKIMNDSVQHTDARARLTDYTVSHKSARTELETNVKNQNQSTSSNQTTQSSLPPRSSRNK